MKFSKKSKRSNGIGLISFQEPEILDTFKVVIPFTYVAVELLIGISIFGSFNWLLFSSVVLTLVVSISGLAALFFVDAIDTKTKAIRSLIANLTFAFATLCFTISMLLVIILAVNSS